MPLPLAKPNPDLDAPQDHYDRLHDAAHGVVVVWERASGPAGSGHWHKLQPGDPHIPGLLAAQSGKRDRYITVNEFRAWRLVRNLKSLRACYVDLDGNVDLDAALEALRDARMPSPTMAIWSGRGLHIYWRHDPVPAAALPVWQRCQDALVAALKPAGADPAARDCTRVLRLVGSINSRSNTAVRGLVLDPAPYPFRHLCNEILCERKPRPAAEVRDFAAAKARRGERIVTGSIYDRWHHVYRDLLKIAEWHFLGGIPDGHRNDWLFLSGVALSWFARPETLRYELERQAQAWTPGLTAAEIRSALHAPLHRAELAAAGETFEWRGETCDPRYRFKRETLYQRMAAIIPPELAPQLRAIVSDEVRAEHKRETDGARWRDVYTGTGVRTSNEAKRATARLLRAQGATQRAIAAELGVSSMTVSRWLRAV